MDCGIDFGTTNSSIALADGDGIYSMRVGSDREPFHAVLRSAVLDPLGPNPVIGELALRTVGLDDDIPLLRSFKLRLEKQRLRELRSEIRFTPTREHDFVNDAIKMVAESVLVPLNYDEFTRDQVVRSAALLVRRLFDSEDVEIAARAQGTGQPLPRGTLSRVRDGLGSAQGGDRVYVGVPVAFGPTARRRFLRALVQSQCFGSEPAAYKRVLERCRFVYEPLAIASNLALFESTNVLVFDYGGGSLDLALLDFAFDGPGPPKVTQLALGGRTEAGDALDARFRGGLLEEDDQLRATFERTIATGSPQDRAIAEGAFTTAKQDLSQHEQAEIVLPGFRKEVTRWTFERIVSSDVDAAVRAVEACLQDGGVAASEVGHVVLTGGSSLIPIVQARVQALFAHLGSTEFRVERAGNSDSELEALTGVSRGLARFGALERFETTAAANYRVLLQGSGQQIVCLPRGAKDTYNLEDAPTVTLQLENGRRRHSFPLYSDLLQTTFCGAIGDLPVDELGKQVEFRVAAHRDRFVPAFGVYRPGESEPLAQFDLEAQSAEELAAFVESDGEWLPRSPHLECGFLIRPLQLGDFVEWRERGRFRRGKILWIRDINANHHVERMDGLNPSRYVITVALESDDGAVSLGHTKPGCWKPGEVRLA